MSRTDKTNVVRIAEQCGIIFNYYHIDLHTAVSGVEMAEALHLDQDKVFKTLVAVSSDKKFFVFMIPVAETLDLKKAAAASKVKSLSMLPQKDLLPITGYVHGGCSPIGMKKTFPTFIDETALIFDRIVFSAGKIGHQIEMSLNDLQSLINCVPASLTV